MFSSIEEKRKKEITFYALLILGSFWWLPFSWASDSHAEPGIAAALLGHLEDHHSLHFGHVHLELPIILYKEGSGWLFYASLHSLMHDAHALGIHVDHGHIAAADGLALYDFSITKNVVGMLWSIFLLFVLLFGLAHHLRRRKNHTPAGLWILPYKLVVFIRNEVARKQIGEKHYEPCTPYLLTLFLYILANNILGLVPEGANITGNLSITLTLSVISCIVIHSYASGHYWRHIFAPPDLPLLLYPIIVPIEIFSTFILRPFIMSVRLFANMLGGHAFIVAMLGTILILQNVFTPIIIIPIGIGVLMLKLFVSFLQAYIFTLLTAVALGRALKEEHHHETHLSPPQSLN